MNNSEAIKNDPFGGKIYAKISKNYNLQDDGFPNPNHSLSPILSDTNSNNTRLNNARNDSKMRGNSDANRHEPRRQHTSRNNEKRNNLHEGNRIMRRTSNPTQQNHAQKGPYRNGIPSPVMYPQMGNEMMPPPIFGPTMMQPNYFMPQPQMYNQYYNYPSPQQGTFYPKIY